MLVRNPFVGVALGVLLLSAAPGCAKKKRGRDCGPAARRTDQYLGALCRAVKPALRNHARALASVRLARADLPAVSKLPEGPVVVLEPSRLRIGLRVWPRWASHWPKVAAGKPAKRPAAGKAAKRPACAKAGSPDCAKVAAKPTGPKATGTGPRKNVGMLGVLSRMNQKLGGAFGRDTPTDAETEDALGALMGHTVGDDSGLGGLGLGGGFVAADLVKELRKLRGPGATKDELALAIAADTPARQVVSFLDVVRRAGFARVAFLVTPTKVPPIPGSPVPVTGEARLAPERGQPLAKPDRLSIQRIAAPWTGKGCADVQKLLDELHARGAVDDCAGLAAAVRRVVAKCGCRVDERPLLDLVHRFASPLVYVAVHRVRLSAEAKPTKVTDAAQPWSKLFASVRRMKADAFRLTGFVLGRSAGWGGLGDGGGGGGGGGIGLGSRTFRSDGPKVFLSRASVSGGLDAATIRRVVRRHLSELRYCYVARGLTAKPKLKGYVKVSWTITLTGLVGQASVVATTLEHGPTESCLLSAIRRWRFPRPEGSMPFVTYPIHFKP